MAIGKDETCFHYNRESIIANAPQASGVYAIFRAGVWVYFGETEDIRRRLLEHLAGDNQRITQENPTGFQYELVAAHERVARQDAWILARDPVANRRLG